MEEQEEVRTGTRHPLVGSIVEVYFNRTRGLWSVRVDGSVVCHAELVVLHNAEFCVSDSGVERIRDRGAREVVAWVRGQVAYIDEAVVMTTHERMGLREVEHRSAAIRTWEEGGIRIVFNPFEHRSFVTRRGHVKVTEAERVVMAWGVVVARNESSMTDVDYLTHHEELRENKEPYPDELWTTESFGNSGLTPSE